MVLMNLNNEVLHKYLYKGVVIYLNDVLIYSDDYLSHVKLVREVLNTLNQNMLYTIAV